MTYLEGDLHMVGFWWSTSSPTLPKPQKLVDTSWESEDHERIVNYLRAGLLLTSYLGYSFCRFECGIPDSELGASDFTDGVWVWPQGLHHYPAEHAVKLPALFIDHMRSQRFVCRQDFDTQSVFRNLPTLGQGLRIPYSSDRWIQWARAEGALNDAA
jgi:hypothetical protein